MPESLDYLFCYDPHRQAVVNFLHGLGAGERVRRLSSVDRHDKHRMAGLENLTFFDVLGHPYPLPNELRAELNIRGATIVTLDDSYRRARFQSKAATAANARKETSDD